MTEERLAPSIDRIGFADRIAQIVTQEIKECGSAAKLIPGGCGLRDERRPQGEIVITPRIVIQRMYGIAHAYDNGWTAFQFIEARYLRRQTKPRIRVENI